MEISAQQLQIILETSRLMNTQLEKENLLDLVLEKAMEVVQAEAGTLWMAENEGYLIPLVAKGPNSDKLKNMKLKPGEGLAGQTVASGTPCLIEDVSKDAHWSKRFDQQTGFVTKSILAIPLQGRSETIGCLQFVNKHTVGCFSSGDLELAAAFAGQAAVALENGRMYQWQNKLFDSILRVLTSALDARDPYTCGHSERVSQYSLIIGKALGFTESELKSLVWAAVLHDIGKIGIPDAILAKAGPLSDEEYAIIKGHTEIGAKILSGVEPAELAGKLYEGALYHQEKYNGRGYPQGISGENTPLTGRIIAVADCFDAITSDRAYRKGSSLGEALKEIQRCSGSHFDPVVVEAFIKAMEGIDVL